MKRRTPRIKRNPEAGQSLVVAAFAMTALLAMLGFAIDFGYLRYTQRQMQALADSAAVAAALQIPACGASPGCASLSTAAQTALTVDNGVPNVSSSTSCTGNAPSLGATIIVVNNPPSCLPAGRTFPDDDPNNGKNGYAEALVFQNQPTFFSRIFGINSMQMMARAEALSGNGSNCVYGLGATGTDITFIVAAGNYSCGIVDESGSAGFFSPAYLCLAGTVNAPYIGVHGSADNLLCGGTRPKTGIVDPTPGDPLNYLQANLTSQAPGTTACGTATNPIGTNQTITGAAGAITVNRTGVTLNPGTYCGGITIGLGANVTFNPGIYTITSTTSGGTAAPGGLSINAGATVTGNGVGFYNYGPNGGVNFLCTTCLPSGGVTLTAPNSSNCGACGAAWQGILFYQDPGDTATSTVIGAASFNTKLTGTTYVPDATVQYSLDADVNYNILVAKNILFAVTLNGITTSGTNFNNNYTELLNGSPIKGGVTLVE